MTFANGSKQDQLIDIKGRALEVLSKKSAMPSSYVRNRTTESAATATSNG